MKPKVIIAQEMRIDHDGFDEFGGKTEIKTVKGRISDLATWCITASTWYKQYVLRISPITLIVIKGVRWMARCMDKVIGVIEMR